MKLDQSWKDMDKQHIDLACVRPAIYSPYQYFGIDKKLGETGEWKKHYPDAKENASRLEKAR